ncbi:MAG: alpha-N-acetylglucosaminidase C-terminal domain-containing protein, partial [Bacteroidales bacterium]|nr:alpha-N-acetylglucosaminidase C-terminal domain-containing protein [Bacteroidales bacterium]
MRPVLSAFNGHVPEQLKEIYPVAAITDIKHWGGFPAENLCHFLSPMDSLYPLIQKEFLQEQTRLFGTDHIYGMDLFNEVEAPSWDPETLASMSEGAYNSIASVDPDALWLQMGWLFFYDQKHWTKENVEAYLKAVPQDKVLILDYYIENTPVWKLTDSFYGQPYILCYLGNFGGNVRLAGNFHQTSERIEDAFANGGSNLAGLGSTLEGFGVNQFMFEYVLDKAWNHGMTDYEWVEALADRRIGNEDAVAREVWKSLADSVYIAGSFSSQTPLMCARPCLEGFWHWTAIHNVRYANSTLARIWRELLSVQSHRDTYRFDVVNIGTQVLGNHFASLRDEFVDAYRSGDIHRAREVGDMMLALIDDIDALAACEPQLRLDRWLDDAAACASTPEEVPYYTRNARTLISIWGLQTSIRDYASRLWSGFVDSYCKPRWEMFIEEILSCIAENRAYDEVAFFERLEAFENAWATQDQTIEYRSSGDFRQLSYDALEKYGL